MAEFKYSGVNTNAKALEEQNENLKKPNVNENGYKKTSFNPKNYLDLKLQEHESTKTVKVRLLPISATDGTVFLDIITHSLKVDKEIARSGFKSYVCLNSDKAESNEECPICKKSRELFEEAAKARNEGQTALSKTLFKNACSYKKKHTFISRVIDRDHEDEGVKFWRFNENSQGKGIYDILMALYETRKSEAAEEGEENYSIFDLYNGKDIIINVSKSLIPDGFGGTKETIAYNITDSGNRKPLSKDVDKANEWLNDPKTWRDVYSLKNADYLELVVNGKIPVFDKEKGKFVEKVKAETDVKIAEEEAASEVLKANYKPTTNEIRVPEPLPLDDENTDDLPF